MAAAQPKCPNCGAPPAPGTPLTGDLLCSYCSTPYGVLPGRKLTTEKGAAGPAARKLRLVSAAFTMVFLGVALFVLVRGGGHGSARGGAQSVTPANIRHVPPASSEAHRAASTGVSLLTPSPPAKPKEPEQPATARFVLHGTRAGYKSSFYVLGEFENTSPFTISKPELITVLLDAGGKELDTDSGYATKDYLEPGEKSFVSALVNDPPAHESMRFEVVARRATYKPTLARGLRILDAQVRTESWGGYQFSGKVENAGDLPARFLHVEVFAFDGAKKLLGLASGYAKTDRLEPGQSARYQITTTAYDRAPAHFETTVTGRVAD